MQISANPLIQLGGLFSKQTALPLNPVSKTLQDANRSTISDQPALSSITSFAVNMQLTDISLQAHRSSMSYRKDGSTALHAESAFNYLSHTQDVSIDLTLPSESLAPDLLGRLNFNGKPISINFEYFQSQTEVEYSLRMQEVKTLRRPEEIISDLADAFSKIMREKGDKSVAVAFDEEAVRVLMSDARMAKLTNELVGLIGILNNMKLHNGPRDRYLIQLSGKGQPYMDVREETNIRTEQTRVTFNLTIQPPQQPQPVVEASTAPEIAEVSVSETQTMDERRSDAS